MQEVTLSFATLDEADLTDTYLEFANLSDATLRNADLTDAYLYGANLLFADLDGAILIGTTLPDGSMWSEQTDIERFTNPEKPSYWNPCLELPSRPAYCRH